MTFGQPYILYLLLLLVPLGILLAWNRRRKQKLIQEFLGPEARRQNVVRGGQEIDLFKALLLMGAVGLFILAWARPQWGEKVEAQEIKGLELVFALDTSASMAAEDLQPSRLEVAKNLIATLVDGLQTDFVALIDFAAVALIQCPLTQDYEAFKLLVQASPLSPEGEQGTDFSGPFQLATRTFRALRGGAKVLLLITDGEDQEKRWPEALEPLKKAGIPVFTVGVGVPQGAPIPLKDREGKIVEWKKDKAGNLVQTRLDEPTLMRIAAESGGRFFRLSEASGIAAFLEQLRQFQRQVLAQKIKRRKIERFAYPLLAGFILLLAETALSDRKMAWKRS